MDTGTVVKGFRIERLLGSGSLGSVYEATQISLGRTVALRIIGSDSFPDPESSARFRDQLRWAAAVHHPHIVPTYEAGPWGSGSFVATRYVRGQTLADLLADGLVTADDLGPLLAPLDDALAVVHEAGLVHGRVSARNILVDPSGAALLADLGLGRGGGPAADRDALADLIPSSASGKRPIRRRFRPAAALAALAFAGVFAALLSGVWGGEDDDADAAPPPAVANGAAPIGSTLAAGPALSLGCAEQPGPNTPACTVGQLTIAGRPTVVREPGVIRGWAVRGAEGELALQVVGRRESGPFLRGFSQIERASDRGPHSFDADVRVQRGDRIGVLLTPGAVIGARAREGSTALRWEGALGFTPRSKRASRLANEILLRVDIESGAIASLSQVSGAAAARARPGVVLDEDLVSLGRGGAVRIALVEVDDGISIDALRGGRRLARVVVPDIDPAGRLLAFEGHCGYRNGFCLRWLNEGAATPIIHAYRLAPDGGAFRPIG